MKKASGFKKDFDLRLNLLVGFFLFLGIAAIFRLFQFQILNYSFYSALASDQREFYQKLIPKRGEIFLQNKFGQFYPLALNKNTPFVYAVPSIIKNPEEVFKKINDVLNFDDEEKEKVLNKLKKNSDPYEIIKKRVSEEEEIKIKNLSLDGVYVSYEIERYYPAGSLASHISGFYGYAGEKRMGQYGVEGFYNKILEGEYGIFEGEKDGFGNWISIGGSDVKPARDGADLILTIDSNIQFAAENKLKKLLDKWESSEGSVIVMEPKTGRIIAMANFPNFNPNEYFKASGINDFLNNSIQGVYEPGSIFKPITMAGALNENVVTPETVYEDEGELKIGGYVIRNFNNKAFGKMTMTQVLEKSLNTGAVFAERQLGKELFRKYVSDFGFGEKTNIDLGGEVVGNIENLKAKPEINYATAAFGQGISATPLQIITAIAAIANEGKLMSPYIVDKIIYSDGKEEIIQPKIKNEIISPISAKKLSAMMVNGVENGFDKARVKGYYIAGKTGTAQIPAPEGGYLDGVFIHSFVGFAPAYNPRFVILMKMDRPQGITFAADSITPVFKELAEYILDYYEIPPDRN